MHHQPTRRTVLAGAAATAGTLIAPRARAQSDDVIRIGVLTDMAGTYAALTGPGTVLAARMAIEDFAKTHPDIKVELLQADLQLKPDVAVGIAADWFDSKGVDLLTDVPLSSAAIAIGEMAKAKDKLAIFTGAASAQLTGPHCGPNHLHWVYDTWGTPHAVVQATVQEGGTSWFFITADYTFGHSLADDSGGFVKAAGGTVVGQAAYPFPGTTDFSAYIVRAKASGAKVIGLANGGQDLVNCIKQGAEFGIVRGGQRVVGLGLLVIDIASIGLQSAQGVLLSEPYYWNLNEGTREFGRRFAARMTGGAMPDSAQAGEYSAVTHYLKAVAAMGVAKAKASGRGAIAEMKEIPVQDQIFGTSTIRADGRVIHPMYLFEAKKPAESTEKWDLLKLLRTIPADQAFRPLNDGNCPMVRS